VIFQAAFAILTPRAATKVDFEKDDRPPLLVIGNDKDHTVPASVSKEAAKRLAKSNAVVDYKEFAGRPHFTAGAPGLGGGRRLHARLGQPPHEQPGGEERAGYGLRRRPPSRRRSVRAGATGSRSMG
jgi:dienelactone hydrolase